MRRNVVVVQFLREVGGPKNGAFDKEFVRWGELLHFDRPDIQFSVSSSIMFLGFPST